MTLPEYMRRFFLAIFMLAIPFTLVSAQFKGGYGGLYDSATSSKLRSDVSFLASDELDGRAAGSEGERKAAAFLGVELERNSLTMLSPADGDIFGMKLPDGDTLASRNVTAVIPGYDKALRDKYIVIGARLDNAPSDDVIINGQPRHRIYHGANGNASGIAMLNALSRKLSENRILLKRSILIVGFGASARQHAGAWYFLNRSFPAVGDIEAMIDLDMIGMPSGGFYAYTGANAGLDALLDTLSGTLQPIKPTKVRICPCESDFSVFYDAGIPSVLFTTGRYHEYMTERDTPDILEYDGMERELEYLFNYCVALANCDNIEKVPQEEKAAKAREKSADDVVQYFDCDRKPTFLGSSDPREFLSKWVYRYLRYPEEALRRGVQGKVLVDFVIDRSGTVTSVSVRKGVDELLDAEAVRVIEASPKWRPGYLGGQKVNARLSLYVEFRLEKKNKR